MKNMKRLPTKDEILKEIRDLQEIVGFEADWRIVCAAQNKLDFLERKLRNKSYDY